MSNITPQNDGGKLKYQVRLDFSKLPDDVNNANDIMSLIGKDVTKDDIINRVKQIQRESVIVQAQAADQAAEHAKEKANEQWASAKKAANDYFTNLQKSLASIREDLAIPFTINVDSNKGMSQSEIDAINAQDKSRLQEITSARAFYNNQPAGTQVNTTAAVQGQNALTEAIQNGRRAYADADATTKQYLDELTFLEMQLAAAKAAQTDLNKQLDAGSLSQERYIEKSAQIKASQEQLATSIKEVKAAQALYAASLNDSTGAGEKTLSIMAELRELKNKIASDRLSGIVNQDDIDRATQLEQALRNTRAQLELGSSNTAGVDALSEGVRGLVGGFTALSGVIGLFSDDSSKANQIMMQSVNFMSILIGLEQVSQTLATNGKLNSFIKSIIAKNNALQSNTTAQTANNAAQEAGAVAQEANAAATEADTVAKEAQIAANKEAEVTQWSLNAAMEANPAGVIIVAITALIGAIELLGNSTDNEIEKQTKLNETLLQSKKLYDELSDVYTQGYKDAVTNAEHQLAVAQATGKSGDALKSYYDAVDSAKERLVNFELGMQGITGSLQDQKNQVEELRAKWGDLIEKLKSATQDGTGEKQVKLLQSQADNVKHDLDVAQNLVDQRQSLINDRQTRSVELQKQANDKALESDTAYWQSKVTIAQKGTKDWLNAQLALNAATYNKSVSNPNASSGDLASASANKYKADLEANKTYNLQVLQDNQDLIDTQLDQVAQGSAEELALKLKGLELQKEAAILNANQNAAAIEKINADSQKKQDDLKKQYEQTQLDRLIDLQKSIAQINLSGLSKDSEGYLDWTKQLNNVGAQGQVGDAVAQAAKINPLISPDDIKSASVMGEQQALDFANRIESIDTDLAYKIRAIWAQTNEKNKQSDNDFVETQIANANKIVDIQSQIAKEKNNAIIANQNSSNIQKANAQLGNNQIDIDATQKKLENIAAELQKNYGAAGDAVKEYINQVEADFSKIEDLSKPDSDISHALDGIKDPKAKQNLEELLKQMNALSLSAKDLKAQKLSATFEGIEEIGNSISSLGDSIGDLNDGLGDTISDLGKLIAGFSQIAASAATGNVVGIITGVISLVTSVIGMFSAAKKSAKEAAAQIDAYNTQLVVGQVQYNEELLQSQKLQDGITQGKYDELKAQLQLNEAKTKGYQTDLDSLTAQLAATGQYISGEHTKKYGGVFGLAKKTKVVQDFSSLGITTDMSNDQIAAILQQKEALNELTGDTKTYADEWLQVYQNLQDNTDQVQELKEQLTEAFSGTTADNIAKAITDGLSQGKTAVAQFGSDFNKIIAQSLMASITNTLESGAVAKIWNDLTNYATNGNGTLTSDQIAALRNEFNAAVTQGNQLLQQAEQVFPDLASTLNSADGLTASIKGMTEDTADALTGLFRNQLTVARQTNSYLLISNNHLSSIQKNTAQTVAELKKTVTRLDKIVTNTTPQPATSLRDSGQTLP